MKSLGELFTTALTNADVQGAEIVDYGDHDAFLSLWNIADNGFPAFLGKMADKSAAIIVWDGRVPGGAESKADRLKPHITPMDWALAFSIKTLDCKNAAPSAKFSIHIVDLTGEDHEKSWAMVMRHQLLAEMPWVTLHGPLIPTRARRRARYRDGYCRILNDGLNDGEVWTLNAGTTLAEGVRLGWGGTLVDVGRQWAASLVQSHDHHDLNNVVGPWILAGIVPKERTPSLKAFWTRLEWTGFACQGSKKPPGEEPVKADLDVLAVDDELAAGWNHVLVSKLLGWETPEDASSSPIPLIGRSARGRLFGTPDPADLLGHLGFAEDGEPNIEKYKRRVFDSPINDGDQTRPWLLVLDLRLFSGRQSEERAWFKKLLKIVQPIAKVPAADLAWEGFEDAETKRIEAWISGSNDDTAYDTALSLFPRLCALRWPSVPIVLFSGTGRRNLITKLAEYGNIFLAPPKPNALAANAAEQVEMFLTDWRSKFDAAMPWVEAQRLCRQILCAAERSRVVNRRAGACLKHFELYVDESGKSRMPGDPKTKEPEDKRFVVGGLLMGYRGENDSGPMELHRRMADKGLRWWPEQFGSRYLIKNQQVVNEGKSLPGGQLCDPNTIIESFVECLYGMQAWGVCVEYNTDDAFYDHGKLLDPAESDNRYRLVLSTLLELVLFDLLPQIAETWTISVFVATRVREVSEFGIEYVGEVKLLSDRFGYFLVGQNKIITLNEDGIFPLVSEIAQRRCRSLSFDQLRHARGVVLAYPELLPVTRWTDPRNIRNVHGEDKELRSAEPKWKNDTRHQHYLADIIAHFCRNDGGQFRETPSAFTRIFEQGMYDVCDARLGALLIAARLLDADDRSEAILALEGVDFAKEFDRRSAATLLLKRLARVITDDFAGHDFSELANGIEIRSSLQENPASPHRYCGTAGDLSIASSAAVQPAASQGERGTIVSIFPDRGFGYIKPDTGNGRCHFWINRWGEGQPEAGMRVEFERYQVRTGKNEGKQTASWIRPLA